jgi:hypothetical protein
MKINYEAILGFVTENYDKEGLIKQHINSLVKDQWTIENLPLKFNDIYFISLGTIAAVEKFSLEVQNLDSSQKRKAVVKFLDSCVEGGFLFEMFDGIVINQAIDSLVDLLNNQFGHDWSAKLDQLLSSPIFGKK